LGKAIVFEQLFKSITDAIVTDWYDIQCFIKIINFALDGKQMKVFTNDMLPTKLTCPFYIMSADYIFLVLNTGRDLYSEK
jgi:hypothetical protein